MATNVDRFKSVVLTQGAADAFVEGEVSTGLVPENGEGWLIREIEFRLGAASITGFAADGSIVWSVSRDTKAAVAGYDDDECIISDGIAFALTTSGAILQRLQFDWQPPQGLLIVEDTMYVQLDSTATGLTNTLVARIHYEVIKVSEIDILRMLNNA